MTDDLLVLFPGALGDFICFWPVLQALREQTRGRVMVVARPEPLTLLPERQFTRISIDRREVSDLFGASLPMTSTRTLLSSFSRTHTWTGHGLPDFAQRVAEVTGGRVHVHPFRDMRPREHATSYYARCVDIVPKPPVPFLEPAAVQWARALWATHQLDTQTLVYHPGSGSRRKNWAGMDLVARWWRRLRLGKVVSLRGPAEDRPSRDVADVFVEDQPLAHVAALLQRASLYLGNDSGISHLAGLVGTPGVVLFGPSDPITWCPLGRHLCVLAAPAACERCGRERFCVHRLSPDIVLPVVLSLAQTTA